MDTRGVKISQLAAWNKGINVGDKELFEIASEGQSYKISATTLVQSVITQIREELDKYALKEKTVGYPAEKRSLLPIWRVTDSSLYEVLYANNGFIKNTQLDGIINNTRSYFYSDDFEREHAGFSIWKSTGGWNVECDNLYVRKAIKAKEYVIESINALKGTQILSAANGEIKSVEETTYNGVEVYQIAFEGDLLSYRAGDIILHQTYGDPNQPLSQRRYIAVIQSVSEGNQFIRLNKSDFVDNTGSYIQDVPVVGDETVQYGHISDPDRQGLIQLSAAYNIDGSGSKPYISIVTDINGRYGLDISVAELVKGNISTAGKTRSILGHLKDFPYRPTDTSIRPNSGFGIVTDNGLFSGRVMATEGNIMNLLTIGGNIDQYWDVTGGTAGIYGGTELSAPRYNDTAQPVRFFAGGDYSQAKTGTTPVVIKADGSGYLADGNISWDDVGNTKISAELTIVTPSGNKDLVDYIQGVSNELQNQIDKAVESWFYPFDPSTDRPPVTIWRDEATNTGRPFATVLKQHINDTYTNVWDGTPGGDPNTGITKGGTIGASWRWTLKSGTTGDNISDYQWTQISDSALNDALNKLGKLQTQVDGIAGDVANKITTYVTSYPAHSKEHSGDPNIPPLNYKKGDLWYNTLTTSIKVSTATNSGYNFNDWDSVVDDSLDYLKNVFEYSQALNNSTKIIGGLVSTSLLRLGGLQTSGGIDNWVEQAGISGVNPTKADALRAWFGGQITSSDTTNAPIWFRANGTAKIGRMEVTTDALKFWGANTSTPLLEINSSSSTLVLNGSGTFTGIVNATGGTFNNITVKDFVIGTGKIGPFYVAAASTEAERWGPALLATMDGQKPPAGNFTAPNSFKLYGGNDSAIGWLISGQNGLEDYIEARIGTSSVTSAIIGSITSKTSNPMVSPIIAIQKNPSVANSIVSGQTFAGVFAGHIFGHSLTHPWQLESSTPIDYIPIDIYNCAPVVIIQPTKVVSVAVPFGKPAIVPTPNSGVVDDLCKIVTFVNIGISNLIFNGNLGSGWQLRTKVGVVVNPQTVAPGRAITIAFRMKYGDAYIINYTNYGV